VFADLVLGIRQRLEELPSEPYREPSCRSFLLPAL
jgi:hypothetical protein